jgi:hypothetical protein
MASTPPRAAHKAPALTELAAAVPGRRRIEKFSRPTVIFERTAKSLPNSAQLTSLASNPDLAAA